MRPDIRFGSKSPWSFAAIYSADATNNAEYGLLYQNWFWNLGGASLWWQFPSGKQTNGFRTRQWCSTRRDAKHCYSGGQCVQEAGARYGSYLQHIRADRFLLAAIIYVDDTDLLHWAKFYGIEDEEFVGQVQEATTDWGMLVHATGGAGKARLKTKQELARFSINIPQSNGTTATIPLEANDVTKKTLGVWGNPLNQPTVPLIKLKEKGLDWVDKLRVRPLERKLTWLSLTSQQYPTLFYGLSSLYASPDELETVMGSVYFNALPFLGYNRNINKAYRTLPTDFQRDWAEELVD
eukprot:scaffold11103_cov25-Cyclotella_meneghiniana.AAC.4